MLGKGWPKMMVNADELTPDAWREEVGQLWHTEKDVALPIPAFLTLSPGISQSTFLDWTFKTSYKKLSPLS